MIPTSLVERTLRIIEAMPNIPTMDALKLAIEQENKFLAELLDNKTERARKLREAMCTAVYASQVLKNALIEIK